MSKWLDEPSVHLLSLGALIFTVAVSLTGFWAIDRLAAL
jgi:hypothetical protein